MNAKAWGVEFVNALNNNNWDETIRIKNESVPDKIYNRNSTSDEFCHHFHPGGVMVVVERT